VRQEMVNETILRVAHSVIVQPATITNFEIFVEAILLHEIFDNRLYYFTKFLI